MEILGFFIKILTDEPPFFIVKRLFKMIRILNVFLLSVCFYKKNFGDFVLVENPQELVDFFISGFFIKPLIIFIVVVLVLDVILYLVIEEISNLLVYSKIDRKLDKIEL